MPVVVAQVEAAAQKEITAREGTCRQAPQKK